jgi:hypothetical protein
MSWLILLLTSVLAGVESMPMVLSGDKRVVIWVLLVSERRTRYRYGAEK